MRRFRIALHVIFICCVVFIFLPGPFEAIFSDLGGDLEKPLSPRARAHYKYLKSHFEQPFDGYGRFDVFVPQFAAVFLSHSAIGFLNTGLSQPELNDEIGTILDEVTRRSLSKKVSPYRRNPAKVSKLGNHNLYLSHVNLIIGARRLISGDPVYDELHKRISKHLVRKSLGSGSAHARSYPGSPRFPADQAVTLASLHLYDLCHQTQISKRPVAQWLRYMETRATDKRSGLHRSSLRNSFPNAKVPRGCALSWTGLYMAQFAPDQAFEQYSRYRKQYYLHLFGWGGFREYPEGISGRIDLDYGPIVFGMGMAATGIGLGSARIFGDKRGYVSILRTATSVGLPRNIGYERSYRLSPLLGEAILFHGMTARRWDQTGGGMGARFDEQPPAPVGAIVQLVLLLLFLAVSIKRVITLLKSRPQVQ